MMTWISRILSLFRYWKIGGIIILSAAFLLSFYLAKERGAKLAAVNETLEAERKKFQTQLLQIEKARQDDKERQIFRKSQNAKIKLADDHAVHDVYKRLRERQANRHPG